MQTTVECRAAWLSIVVYTFYLSLSVLSVARSICLCVCLCLCVFFCPIGLCLASSSRALRNVCPSPVPVVDDLCSSDCYSHVVLLFCCSARDDPRGTRRGVGAPHLLPRWQYQPFPGIPGRVSIIQIIQPWLHLDLYILYTRIWHRGQDCWTQEQVARTFIKTEPRQAFEDAVWKASTLTLQIL